MKRILLIRHAQSTNNAVVDRLEKPGAKLTGEALREAEARREADCDLSPLGFKQAALLARAVAASNLHRPKLVVSPMLRALRTAQPVADALGLDRERFLCHADFYEVGGSFYLDQSVPTSTPDEIAERFAVLCRGFAQNGWGFDGEGRESGEHADARVTRALRFLQDELRSPVAEFDSMIVVAHGEFLLRLMRRWLCIPIGHGVAIIHANTGITSLTWDDRRGMLMHAINDLSHLPADVRTGDGPGWWDYVAPELSITR